MFAIAGLGPVAPLGNPWRRLVVALALAFGVSLALSACQPGAPGLSLLVNTTADGHDAHPGDGVCEMTTGHGDCSLRAAIEEANASTAGTPVITVPPGTYRLQDGRLVSHPAGSVIIRSAGPGAAIDAGRAANGLVATKGVTLTFGLAVSGARTAGFVARSGASLDVIFGSSHHNGTGLVVDTGGSAATLHTTLSDNRTAGITDDGTLASTFTTVTANKGGGILGTSAPMLSASIVANQKTGADCATPATSAGYNLDSDGTCGLTATADVTVASAQLGALTSTALAGHPPLPTSPAINAVPTGAGPCLVSSALLDQTGQAMPVGSGCDRGAIEANFAPLSLTVDSSADSRDTLPGDGVCATAAMTCTLRAAIDETNAWPSSGDTITIAPGVDPTLTIPGVVDDQNATGDLDITDALTLHGNGATLDANGLDRALDERSGPVAIDHLTVTGGVSFDGSGQPGPVQTDGGGILAAGALTLTDVTVTGNQAADQDLGTGHGGGIFTTADLTLVGSTLSNNRSGNAGSALIAEGPTTVIRDTTITGNDAEFFSGSDSTSPSGGAAVFTAGQSLTVSGSTIDDNTGRSEETRDGESVSAALFVQSGTALVTNTTISHNAVLDPDFPGFVDGAIDAVGPTTLLDDTVVGTPGADLTNLLLGTMTMGGTIVDSPSGGACTPAVTTPPTITSLGFNLISDASCGLTGTGDRQSTDALLGPLADNTGPTRTQLPAAGSPAVDAIPIGTTQLCDGTIATDQRGVARPQGPACDIGAVEAEFAPLSLTVDSSADSHDTMPGDGVCATAAMTCTLRAAIDETNAWPSSGDTITIAPGVDPTLTIPGLLDDQNATGDLDITGGLTLHGNGATLDANGLDRALDDLAGPLTIDHLTVTGGNSHVAENPDELDARDTGGGIAAVGALTLTDVTVTGNRAQGFDLGTGAGGGIFATGDLTIVDSTISNNQSDNRGAGIEADGPTTVIRDTTVTGNSGQLILGGSALSPAGSGAVYATGQSVTVSGSTIDDNTGQAEQAKAGLPRSSALWIDADTALVTNTTISHNTVFDPDAPELIDEAVGTSRSMTLMADTLVGAPGSDRSLMLQGNLTMGATIVDAPSGGACTPGDISSPVITSLGFNVFSDATCGLTGTGDRQSTDARLGSLADNTGPTRTQLPGVGSPAIDAIPTGTAQLCDGTIATDQRGVTRPQGPACDIGAVEVVPAA